MHEFSGSALWWKCKPLEGVIPECYNACGYDLRRVDSSITVGFLFACLFYLIVCEHDICVSCIHVPHSIY